MPQSPIVIFDFETTGLSPKQGDRVIEVGAVRIEGDKIIERFSALMNPHFAISPFIARYTGITNAMLATAQPIYQQMSRFHTFIKGAQLIAHNASFDKRFLDAELAELGLTFDGKFACSMLLAKRVFPKAPSYKLGELVKYAGIKSSGEYHRALYDCEMTAQLWFAMQRQLFDDFGLEQLPFELACKLAKSPKSGVRATIEKYQMSRS
ncbi:3'-5' exonuclease [Marinagarivorans algicola]|uniref:3'-5' exonuclease n=1 Tax=Marinagarivorans algicola TaxID=1513270 RepID=UPI0006B5CD8E|nr:3'-5' exonuclease [Marinagarivorans algicola]